MEDIEIIKKIKAQRVCCGSYLTPNGRCYDCPEQFEGDPDEEKQ